MRQTIRNMRKALALGAMLAALLPVSAHAVVPTQEESIAVIRALDKMTARVEEIQLPVGKTTQFGKPRHRRAHLPRDVAGRISAGIGGLSGSQRGQTRRTGYPRV